MLKVQISFCFNIVIYCLNRMNTENTIHLLFIVGFLQVEEWSEVLMQMEL